MKIPCLVCSQIYVEQSNDGGTSYTEASNGSRIDEEKGAQWELGESGFLTNKVTPLLHWCPS